jgi:phosphotriesterase-related protein
MLAITVTGPVDAETLGIVLPHEHLLLDLRNQFTEPADPLQRQRSHEPLTAANAALVRRNPYAIRDNLLLDDLELAAEEVAPFQAAGGRTIVDCTSVGIHREPRKLQAIAQRTGLNIIAGCGYYTHDTHPPEMSAWSIDTIAAQMIRDLTAGIDGSGIRAGVIGEIGTSFPIHPDEKKCLAAAALAFQQTAAPIQVHTYPWARGGLEAVEVLLRYGADPSKIVVCHTDVQLDADYIRQLLGRGVFVEFDNFGKQFVIEPNEQGFAGGSFARDSQRIAALKTLLDEGFAKQLLITGDICLKCMLRRYGGQGYGYVLETIVPLLLNEGVDPAAIELLLQDNPRLLYGQ